MSKLSVTNAAGVACAALLASPAVAEVQAQIGGGYRYESNLFRQPRGIDTIDGRRSDRVATVQGRLDAIFSPADFEATVGAEAAHDWYSRNGQLDNFNYAATLNLTRTPGATIGLALDAGSYRRLTSFSDIRTRLRNIQSLQRITAVATLPVTPDLRVVVTPEFTQSTNSSDLIAVNDFRQYGAGVGLGWYSPLGNSVALTVTRRYTDGLEDRPALIGTTLVNAPIDTEDTSADLRVRYMPGGFTSITGVFSYVNRNDKSLLDNDYRGPAGYVTVAYAPRPSFYAEVSAGRRLDSQSYLFIDSVRSDYVRGSFDLSLLDRLAIGGEIYHERRRFRFDPIDDVEQDVRNDRLTRLSLSAGWRLIDRVQLGLIGYHERRTSTDALRGYRANVIQATASLVFGQLATDFSRRRLLR